MRGWLVFVGVAGGIYGGEDGIRTHVPSYLDQLISSQRRYSHFGTSPFAGMIDPFGSFWIKRMYE